uniref:Uncharacterized protein n=1 Tax=Kalanchoe fedtschenkoi TaxID=63787 RepID=A0A7N0UID6_KALFE
MRKLYRKSTVHPSPPPASSSISDHLAFLPAAIFTLTAALTSEDKEVLAYLLSCSSTAPNNLSCRRDQKQQRQSSHGHKGCAFSDHCAVFSCSCFRCYMSYWVRWDSSPNQQLIHEIIDAFEDNLLNKSDKGSSKKNRRRKGKSLGSNESTRSELTESVPVKEVQTGVVGDNDGVNGGEDDEDGGFSDDGLEFDKGSMRKFVSFIGERIWGVFGGKENDGK